MHPFVRLALPGLFLGGCVAAPPPSVVPPTATEEAEPLLAVDHASLDVDYLLPGAGIEHDGRILLWVVAFGDELDGPTVLRLTSGDAVSWTADDTPVVLGDAGIGFDDVGPIPSSVLAEADGTWTMYGGCRQPGDRSVIWRATAPDPDGPWTIHPEPLLVPSVTGWDGLRVDHPSVVATEDGYLMTYGGSSPAYPNRGRIGAARSPDGITWERVPITLPEADDASAIGPSACGIDARTMFEPELIETAGGYRLTFGAMRTEPDVMVIGAAESRDGVTWRCTHDAPIVEAGEVVADAEMHAYLAVRDRSDLLLVEVLGAEAAFSDLWLTAP